MNMASFSSNTQCLHIPFDTTRPAVCGRLVGGEYTPFVRPACLQLGEFELDWRVDSAHRARFKQGVFLIHDTYETPRSKKCVSIVKLLIEDGKDVEWNNYTVLEPCESDGLIFAGLLQKLDPTLTGCAAPVRMHA